MAVGGLRRFTPATFQFGAASAPAGLCLAAAVIMLGAMTVSLAQLRSTSDSLAQVGPDSPHGALVAGGLGLASAALGVSILVRRRRKAEDALASMQQRLSAAEEAARQSAAFLEGIGAATPGALYAKDSEGRFAYVNPTALRALGRPLDEVLGRRSDELNSQSDEINEHGAADQRVLATGDSEELEGASTGPNGAHRLFRAMKFPLRDPKGAIIGMAGLTIDVTEAHAIRLALAESEAKYRTIANAVPAIVWTANADGLRDFYNERWYEFTGAAANSTDGWNWTRLIHLQDRREVEDHVLAHLAAGEPYEIKYRLIGAQGARWVLERALPLRDDSGQIQSWQGTCTDIQELYESRIEREAAIDDLKSREAHLESILDSVPDAMIVIDDHGIIQSFSATAEAQFGWAAVEAIGRDVNMLMPRPHRPERGDDLTRYLTTGDRKAIGHVMTGQRRDGTTFPMELSVGGRASGERRYFTGFVRDLTERQEAERRFQGMQAELAHVSRLSAMGEMASALAHELNQPLTATASYLQGSLQLLDENPLRETLLRGALTTANQQVLRAGAIIRRLREFIGKGETSRDTESLAQLLDETGALAMVGAKEKGVQLTFDVQPDADLVLVDKVQIQQVLLNLMRNAIEAMAGSELRELAISARQDAQDTVTVSVADTGSGISPTIMERLFQPFVTSKTQGMGVGLSISRTIIEAHGGRIWAEARPGGGTVFNFTLRTIAEEDLTDVAAL